MSWLVRLSVRIMPRGDTLRVTFCSFFPLALAWEGEGGRRQVRSCLLPGTPPRGLHLAAPSPRAGLCPGEDAQPVTLQGTQDNSCCPLAPRPATHWASRAAGWTLVLPPQQQVDWEGEGLVQGHTAGRDARRAEG